MTPAAAREKARRLVALATGKGATSAEARTAAVAASASVGYDLHGMSDSVTALPKVPRTCVFCGKPPNDKNNEHVLPQWLLKLTGDPNRVVTLGIDSVRGQPRRFAFDQLRFPACKVCNDLFARDIESSAQPTMERLLSKHIIDARGAESLLDWFDKVRIGLWLGYRYLDRNVFGIRPHFHIASRVRQKDRMIIIYRTVETRRALTFPGPNTPAFQIAPGCLALRVNNYFFVTISGDSIFSERAGVQHAKNLRFFEDGDRISLLATLEPGTGRVRSPLLLLPEFPRSPLKLYQPIVPQVYDPEGRTEPAEVARAGPLFAESKLGTWRLEDEESLTIELVDSDPVELFDRVTLGVFARQNWLLRLSDGLDADLPQKARASWRERRNDSIKVNNMLVERYCEECGIDPSPFLSLEA